VGRGWPRLRVGIHDGWIGHRGRNILHTGGWSLVAKACTAANLFVCVPFVLHALGPEQFGAWATLVSLVFFAGFLDFGFGNGTMNLVATAHGRGVSTEVGNILREGRRTLLWIALWLGVAVVVALPLVPWYRLLGMPEAMTASSRAAAAAVLFSVVLAVPLNLANRVQLGLGRGDRAFRWQAIGQLLTLAIVVVLAKANASLVVLTTATVATPLLASVANTLQLWRDPEMAVSPRQTHHNEIAKRIRREGVMFFVLQLSAALAFSADLPLISALRGPTEAGTYAIVQRLFSIVPMGLALIWAPLWPIYRHALAAGDHDWVLRTLRRSLLFAVAIACAVALVLALGFGRMVEFWVHRPLAVSGVLVVGFASWCVIDAAGGAIATFLNAAGILRFQVVVSVILAIVTLMAKALVLQMYGSELLPWITMVAYITISLGPTLLSSRRLLRLALASD
jgi:O-antigen/teichoic acid export membrane protein